MTLVMAVLCSCIETYLSGRLATALFVDVTYHFRSPIFTWWFNLLLSGSGPRRCLDAPPSPALWLFRHPPVMRLSGPEICPDRPLAPPSGVSLSAAPFQAARGPFCGPWPEIRLTADPPPGNPHRRASAKPQGWVIIRGKASLPFRRYHKSSKLSLALVCFFSHSHALTT